jgi:NADPH:quinone reductase-like Zn-dependent oxidoreductase
MKAMFVREAGFPGELSYADAPDPEPGDGMVLIRVHSIGVNYGDYLLRLGAYLAKPTFPTIPGMEVAGVIEATGPGATRYQKGQQVVAFVEHAYAELVIAPEATVLPMPAQLSFEQAAAIPVAFGTAWHALTTLANTQKGDRVLIHAAGSGVGSAAIPLAKHLGAWVIATAGQPWKLERARELGADAVCDYQSVANEITRLTDGHGVDVVLEGVGKTTFGASLKSMAEGGRLVTYGSPSGPRVELDTLEAIRRNLTLHAMWLGTSAHFPATLSSFESRVLPWFEQRTLAPVLDQVYELRQAADAHKRMIDRGQFGKLVLAA